MLLFACTCSRGPLTLNCFLHSAIATLITAGTHSTGPSTGTAFGIGPGTATPDTTPITTNFDTAFCTSTSLSAGICSCTFLAAQTLLILLFSSLIHHRQHQINIIPSVTANNHKHGY